MNYKREIHIEIPTVWPADNNQIDIRRSWNSFSWFLLYVPHSFYLRYLRCPNIHTDWKKLDARSMTPVGCLILPGWLVNTITGTSWFDSLTSQTIGLQRNGWNSHEYEENLVYVAEIWLHLWQKSSLRKKSYRLREIFEGDRSFGLLFYKNNIALRRKVPHWSHHHDVKFSWTAQGYRLISYLFEFS